jgi:inosose dehydratase
MPITLGAGSDAWGIWHAAHPAQIPWRRYLDEVRDAGYRYLEPGVHGYLPTDAKTLKRELAARNLAIPGGTVFGAIASPRESDALMRRLDQTAALLAEVGARFLVALDDFYRDNYTGTPTGTRRLDEDGWARFLDMIHRMARRSKEAHGLDLVFHPHCEATIEEEPEIERFVEETDADFVGLCIDTGHHAYCGGDPVSFIRRHHARIPYLHFKSMNGAVLAEVRRRNLPWGEAVRMGVTAEPALGIVDFAALARTLAEVGYSGFAIVEQDMFPCDPATPLPLARRTIAYLEQLGFTR